MQTKRKRSKSQSGDQASTTTSSSSSSAGSSSQLSGAIAQKRSRTELVDPSLVDDEDEIANETADNLHFEDPYADDVDDSGDEVIEEEDTDSDDLQAMDAIDEVDDDDDDDDDEENVAADDDDDEAQVETRVWRAGIDQLQEGEVLDYDSSAYHMLHSLQVEWPCLSFAVVPDMLGFHRTKFPHTAYLVAGTQGDCATNNFIYAIKASDLHKTKNDDADSDASDDDDEEDDDDLDDDPVVDSRQIKHHGAVNRLKLMPQDPQIVASWSDTKGVQLWNIGKHLAALDTPGLVPTGGHIRQLSKSGDPEGFALDWSPIDTGMLLSGDIGNAIRLWNTETGQHTPYLGHQQSVEDLQWSPSESTVFASSSADQYIRIWDTRKLDGAALSVHAHQSDVNVISWNKKVGYLMVSGADDGSFSIWDLRQLQTGQPVAHFNWHKGPVTSVEWNPHDESVIAVASADNQLTLWDLALEKDAEDQSMKVAENYEVPPQLLFVHQGQTDIKELHWHPQIPGTIVSTAASGFNIFKTINS